MRKTKDKLDFDELTVFTMPERTNNATRIKITAKGEMYISKAIIDFIRKDNEEMWVDFRHSEDYKMLAIKRGGNRQFRFPKAGSMKFEELKAMLQNFGYAIPAFYLFEWNEDENMWVGRLQEIAEPVL